MSLLNVVGGLHLDETGRCTRKFEAAFGADPVHERPEVACGLSIARAGGIDEVVEVEHAVRLDGVHEIVGVAHKAGDGVAAEVLEFLPEGGIFRRARQVGGRELRPLYRRRRRFSRSGAMPTASW